MKKNKLVVFLLTLILALSVTTTAFAEEEEGPIECSGPMHFSCHIQNLLLNLSMDGINSTLEEFKAFVVYPAEILYNPSIYPYYKNAYSFCFTLITVMFLYKLVELLVMGDPMERANVKNGLAKLLFTVFLAYSFPKFFQWLLTFNNWYVEAMLTEGASFNVLKMEKSDIENVMNTTMSMFLLAIFGVILLILMLICVFQMAIRSAELAFLFAVSPLMIATNMTDNFNMLPSLWRNLISTIFTHAVQTTLLVLMANVFAKANIWEPHTIFLALGFMFLTVKSPTLLKEYLYSSGSGRFFGGVGSSAVSTVAKEVIRNRLK